MSRAKGNGNGGNSLPLTDEQIRDIIARLESRRILPDEYRFLLFGDKRDVKLLWNGKTTHLRYSMRKMKYARKYIALMAPCLLLNIGFLKPNFMFCGKHVCIVNLLLSMNLI